MEREIQFVLKKQRKKGVCLKKREKNLLNDNQKTDMVMDLLNLRTDSMAFFPFFVILFTEKGWNKELKITWDEYHERNNKLPKEMDVRVLCPFTASVKQITPSSSIRLSVWNEKSRIKQKEDL